jgi:8-oxo-dGTP pyrophosphatase MutT (NUDIX family)
MTTQKKLYSSIVSFEQRLVEALSARPKNRLTAEGLISAAVLVPLFEKNGTPHILLTKRSDQVEHHRGEISFPGGKLDPTDPDEEYCALRETSEEVGIKTEDIRVIGELDDFYTVATRFHVSPFVGVVPYPYEFRTSQREIAGLLAVPLEVFFDPGLRSEDIWIMRGEAIEVISYRWNGHNIWGATARILKHMVELVDDQQRV